MARYKNTTDLATDVKRFERLRLHHDHIKTLENEYAFMRNKQTFGVMRDETFEFDQGAMAALDNSYFTSLIVKLDAREDVFFGAVKDAYATLKAIIVRHFPKASVETTLGSAHITVKSILDDTKQTRDELTCYLPVITPIAEEWLGTLSSQTTLYAVGLFTNVHKAKGLSVGIRLFPSLPLIQIVRGEVGLALYSDQRTASHVRPEETFHTMLTHSTGLRARNLTTPFPPQFIEEFEEFVESYDKVVFGSIESLALSDLYVRNGFSDKLVLGKEICLADGG